MSDTQETDDFIDRLNDDWDIEFAALTAHAKKLERERNRAIEALRDILAQTDGRNPSHIGQDRAFAIAKEACK